MLRPARFIAPLVLLALVALPVSHLLGSSDNDGTLSGSLSGGFNGSDGDQRTVLGTIEPFSLFSAAPTTPSAGSGGLVSFEVSYPFIWPAIGPITSYMGPAHPLGIDIGLREGEDSPIVATAAGTVTFAGGTTTEDYGYHVILDHGSGLSTVYGHLSKVSVVAGQHVNQGDLLGLGGSTGKADGKHLHFEFHRNDSLLDPLRVLPEMGRRSEKAAVDCTTAELPLDRGSSARLDLRNVIVPGSLVSTALVVGTAGASVDGISAVIRDGSSIDVVSAPNLLDQSRQDHYRLRVTYSQPGFVKDETFECGLVVQGRSIAPSYFAPLPEAGLVVDAMSTNKTASTPVPSKSPTATPVGSSALPTAEAPADTQAPDLGAALQQLSPEELATVSAILRAAETPTVPTPSATSTQPPAPTNTPVLTPTPPAPTQTPARATPTRTPTRATNSTN